MKRQYIKPETEIVACKLLSMVAASGNGTGWYMGDDSIGGDEPDPNADDDGANQFNLWEFEE